MFSEHVGGGAEITEPLRTFKLMQTSTAYLRGVNTQDRLFLALSDVNHSVEARQELYRIILTSKALN